jgi:hypothetical protein
MAFDIPRVLGPSLSSGPSPPPSGLIDPGYGYCNISAVTRRNKVAVKFGS